MSDTLDNAIEQWLNAITKATLAERLAIPTWTDPEAPAVLPEASFPSEATQSENAGGTLATILAHAKINFQNSAQALGLAAKMQANGDLKGAGNAVLMAANELKNCAFGLEQASNVDQENSYAFANDAVEINRISLGLFAQANQLFQQARDKKVTLMGVVPSDLYAESVAKSEETAGGIDLDAIRKGKFFPKSKVIKNIPPLWNTDDANLKATVIYLHYYNANADFYVAELDPKTNTAWGYARIAGQPVGKWGAFNLNDLADYGKDASTEPDLWNIGGPIERDESWTPTPAGQIPKIVIS